jgi:eukaryotic-like serine/threonine-protein kinase
VPTTDPGPEVVPRRAARLRRVLVAGGACYAAYFVVLLYCDIRRPEQLGLVLRFSDSQAIVERIDSSSPAQRAGIMPGDQLLQVGAVVVRTPFDRAAFDSRLRFDRPDPVRILRQGSRLDSVLQVRRPGTSFWRTQAGIVLAVMRAAQLAMLVLAFVIAWKRPYDFAACIGAWLLASLAVFCVVLPSRFSAVWHQLPGPLGAALWLPYLSYVAAGAIFATFYTVFPRRARGWRPILTLIWVCMVPLLAVNVYDRAQIVYRGSEGVLRLSNLSGLVTLANLFFAAAGLLVMVSNYHRLSSRSERRRVRLVLVASWLGCTSAACVVALYLLAPTSDFRSGMFSSWSLTAGMLPVLLVPFSFAYAILRHRLFDISLMLRRGLQYALARRLLLLLVPATAVPFIADMLSHRQASMGDVVRGHLWWYAALVCATAWIYHSRNRWLDALDRKYFREHYSAQRLLRELAEDLQRSSQLDQLASAVVGRIEAALHPTYVALLVRSEEGSSYEAVVATPPEHPGVSFSSGDRAIRLLEVFGQPLVVGRDAPRSVFDELPDEERRTLGQSGTELLVAVTGPGDRIQGVLALGVKRSEEPYSREDRDLLSAIAMNLRGSLPQAATIEECEECGASYPSGTTRCRTDGTQLTQTDTPRVLAERYAIERRLGHGGMGTVYAARDLQLNRVVAVKLLRDRVESARAVERCRREARAAAALAHANVVTIHDMGLTSDGRPFLVMELLKGRTLRDALREGPLERAQLRPVFEGVCSALQAAHGQNLVHRDLKPENVFLVSSAGEPDTVKLLDFGISTFVDNDGTTSRSSALMGTPEYASPEQVRGDQPAPTWDVWALAVMAFEAVVGVRPVACVSLALEGRTTVAGAAWTGPALERLTPPMVPFFTRALSLDSAIRPHTPQEFLHDFEQGLD